MDRTRVRACPECPPRGVPLGGKGFLGDAPDRHPRQSCPSPSRSPRYSQVGSRSSVVSSKVPPRRRSPRRSTGADARPQPRRVRAAPVRPPLALPGRSVVRPPTAPRATARRSPRGNRLVRQETPRDVSSPAPRSRRAVFPSSSVDLGTGDPGERRPSLSGRFRGILRTQPLLFSTAPG